MHRDVCSGVIYISNKSQYLKNDMKYERAAKTNVYNLKRSFTQESFCRTNVFTLYMP